MPNFRAFFRSIKTLKEFKELLVFPQTLKDITVGLLLGDASLQRRNPTGGVSFRFAQSYIHLDYLICVFQLFSLYCGGMPTIYEHHYPDGSFKTLTISFQTLTFPWFLEFNLLFTRMERRLFLLALRSC